ncbi:MAG: arylesterase [Gammaproteobacteria bacterium]|nr:MAG: arylesterase [Gammaproteobacteria bacterium]
MLRLLLAIVFYAWAGQALAQQPAILVLGDSLSAGYGLGTDQGWVTLLQQRLQRQGYPYRVINSSISGNTTRGGLRRLPRALNRYRPEIVIVELGGNDGLRGLSMDKMRRNLASIVETSREQGAKVLLVGVRLPPNYGAAYITKFHDVYRNLEKIYQLPLVPYLLDGIGGRDELMQADRLHPRAEAQSRMLDNVWRQLAPMLKRLAPQSPEERTPAPAPS